MNREQIRGFRRTLRRFQRVTNAQLRTCCAGVTLAQCLVLLETDENVRLTVGQLASRLRLDISTLSRTIDGLVRKGLLDRVRDDQDRRVVWICLTAEGDEVCSAIHEENDAICRQVLDEIPESKRAAVLRSFELLVQAYLDSESQPAPASQCGSEASPNSRTP